MHDHFQAHFAAHGGFAKNRLDVEQANAAHFKQVLQQLGAAAFNRGLVDAVQIDRVVSHQTVPARDQLQPQLVFAQARLVGNHHTQACNPFPFQVGAVVFKQNIRADCGRFHKAMGFTLLISRRLSTGAVRVHRWWF